MAAKITAKNGPHLDDDREAEEGKGGLRLLPLAAIVVALVYGATLLWLLLSDNRLAGEPVVRLALAPEEPAVSEPADKPEPPVTAAPDGTGTPDIAGTDIPDPDELSPDEQALLDAARRINGADSTDGDIGGDVRIVGAESVTGGDDTAKSNTTNTIRLAPVPDAALVESTPQGPLPMIARDGRQPWKVYARPVPPGTQLDKRIALVVSGMGISESATAHAIKTLPPEVTLSFAPYGAGLQGWITKARDAGHEVLLELPMEPFGYPQNDPGPYTLLTSLKPAENVSRLEWLMSRFTGYAGVMNYQGARFTTSEAAFKPVISALKSRGLFYVDNGASARSLAAALTAEAKMPAAQSTRIIDPVQNPDVIAASLAMLEQEAQKSGGALGVASGFPVTVDALAQWAETLQDKGFVLVPATATAKQ
jgi:polysaccharide deacetylase 2 family uncharacterized protein YibQ